MVPLSFKCSLRCSQHTAIMHSSVSTHTVHCHDNNTTKQAQQHVPTRPWRCRCVPEARNETAATKNTATHTCQRTHGTHTHRQTAENRLYTAQRHQTASVSTGRTLRAAAGGRHIRSPAHTLVRLRRWPTTIDSHLNVCCPCPTLSWNLLCPSTLTNNFMVALLRFRPYCYSYRIEVRNAPVALPVPPLAALRPHEPCSCCHATYTRCHSCIHGNLEKLRQNATFWGPGRVPETGRCAGLLIFCFVFVLLCMCVFFWGSVMCSVSQLKLTQLPELWRTKAKSPKRRLCASSRWVRSVLPPGVAMCCVFLVAALCGAVGGGGCRVAVLCCGVLWCGVVGRVLFHGIE